MKWEEILILLIRDWVFTLGDLRLWGLLYIWCCFLETEDQDLFLCKNFGLKFFKSTHIEENSNDLCSRQTELRTVHTGPVYSQIFFIQCSVFKTSTVQLHAEKWHMSVCVCVCVCVCALCELTCTYLLIHVWLCLALSWSFWVGSCVLQILLWQ